MTAEIQPSAQPKAALAKPAQTAITTIRDWIGVRKNDISKLLPKHLTVERLENTAAAAMMRTPALQQCSLPSMFAAVMVCAELGLEPTGAYGGVWLVPFQNKKTGHLEVQPIIDYRGMLDIARRSGQVGRIEAHVVHENDLFRLRYGTESVLEHTPAIKGDPGPVVGAYAVAELKDGTKQIEFMTIAELDRIKNRSKAVDSGPWVTDPEEMMKKTILRRLCKLLPRSIEMRRAEEVDDEGQSPAIDVVTDAAAFEPMAEPNKVTRTAKLKERAQAAAAALQPVAAEEPPPMSAEEKAEIEAAEQQSAVSE